MMKLLVAAMMSGALLVNTALAGGGGGGISGGATEITQLSNHAELVAQVGESARQTAIQINQLNTFLQNLQQLPAQTIGQYTNNPIAAMANQVLQAAGVDPKDTQGVLGLINAGIRLESTLTGLDRTASNTYQMMDVMIDRLDPKNMPRDANGWRYFLQTTINSMSPQKRRQLSIYGDIDNADKYLYQLNRGLTSIADQVNDVNRQAQQIPGLSGNLEGLQFLASQNVGIQTSIKQLQGTIYSIEREKQIKEVKKEVNDRDKAMMFLPVINELSKGFEIRLGSEESGDSKK